MKSAIGFAWVLIMVVFSIAFLPFAIPLHALFRLLGRRGFFYSKRSGHLTYSIGLGAFGRG